ncbi:MAG: hypothetical protein M3530_05385 [Thermoproteota archaeon]|nr:hypothetical protein [Thermoproteota archaeon]
MRFSNRVSKKPAAIADDEGQITISEEDIVTLHRCWRQESIINKWEQVPEGLKVDLSDPVIPNSSVKAQPVN